MLRKLAETCGRFPIPPQYLLESADELESALERLKELEKDKERLDWLEREARASGYHIEIRGLSVPQSNAVILKWACGSGPFQKQTQGQQVSNFVRMFK